MCADLDLTLLNILPQILHGKSIFLTSLLLVVLVVVDVAFELAEQGDAFMGESKADSEILSSSFTTPPLFSSEFSFSLLITEFV